MNTGPILKNSIIDDALSEVDIDLDEFVPPSIQIPAGNLTDLPFRIS